MSKHSPTPWGIDRRTNTRIVAENGRGVGSTGGPVNNVESDGGLGENEANAAFIVRAVNCHDDLLAAAKTLLDASCQSVARVAAGRPGNLPADFDQIQAAWRDLKAAIAKAES